MKWPSVQLGEIAAIERSSIAPSAIVCGTRYVGLEHIESGGGSLSYGEVANGELASNKFRFSPNHILFGKLRPYLAKIVAPDFEGICSTDILPILPTSRVNKRYLLHFLRLNRTVDWAASRATGVNLPRLSPSELASLEIPLPPLPEQRRIAAILDKADALRRKRQRTIDLLDSLTQSIFLEMFGEPDQTDPQLPLGNVLTRIDSGWSPSCLDRPADEHEHGVLKLSAITGGQYLEFQNKALPAGIAPKSGTEVAAGDVLLCRKNTTELVGSSVYVWDSRRRLHMSDLFFRLVPKEGLVDPIFLQAQISISSRRRKISEMSGGAAGSMPNVSKARLRELQILVPPIGAQVRFAQAARHQRFAWTTAVQAFNGANSLFASLQHRAFSGQL